MDCSPPGSSVLGIFQARILEWVAFSYSAGSSPPRDGTCESCLFCISRCTTMPPGKSIAIVPGLKKKNGHLVVKVSSCGSDGKESACSAGDPGSIPELGRFPWRREWLPTPGFFLENPMDRGAWRAVVHGVTKSLAWRVTNTSDQGCTWIVFAS